MYILFVFPLVLFCYSLLSPSPLLNMATIVSKHVLRWECMCASIYDSIWQIFFFALNFIIVVDINVMVICLRVDVCIWEYLYFPQILSLTHLYIQTLAAYTNLRLKMFLAIVFVILLQALCRCCRCRCRHCHCIL